MDFFEAWKDRAETRLGGSAKYKAQGFVATQMYEAAVTGIDAAINALKEMRVGEPRTTNVRVREEPLFIWDEEQGEYVAFLKEGKQRTGIYGYIELFDMTVKDYPGTDGEEVVVMVFRDDKEK